MCGQSFRYRGLMTDDGVVSTTILQVRDLALAAEFYRQLGLSVDLFSQDYAFVTYRGRELLHLQLADSVSYGSVYLNVPDVDDWHARCARASSLLTQIEDRPWGMREFSVTDPSGNTLRIGTNR